MGSFPETLLQDRKGSIKGGQNIFSTLDAIRGKPFALKEQYALASYHENTRKRRHKDLPGPILLPVGMKVMGTNNLQVDIKSGA
jgi:hypothetical protein